jgi:hypothetical protein
MAWFLPIPQQVWSNKALVRFRYAITKEISNDEEFNEDFNFTAESRYDTVYQRMRLLD